MSCCCCLLLSAVAVLQVNRAVDDVGGGSHTMSRTQQWLCPLFAAVQQNLLMDIRSARRGHKLYADFVQISC
jgi:hypothetical protein